MVRKAENWEMLLFPQASFTRKHLIGKAMYEDEYEKLMIEIVWDNEFVINERSTLVVTTTKNENYTPVIYVSDRYVSLLSQKEYASTGLWHELGHIHCGHCDLDMEPKEQRRGRYEALLSGGVYYQEIEADSFATRAVGKNRMIQFLQFCKANRTISKATDRNYQLAVKEFDKRISLVKKISL